MLLEIIGRFTPQVAQLSYFLESDANIAVTLSASRSPTGMKGCARWSSTACSVSP